MQHEGAYQVYTNVADCPMYSTIAAQHAQQLVAAGVDFVVVDMTSASTSITVALQCRMRAYRAEQILAWKVLGQACCASVSQQHLKSLDRGLAPANVHANPQVSPRAAADLPEYDQTSDAIQLRPFEVLCQVCLIFHPTVDDRACRQPFKIEVTSSSIR